MAPQAADSVGRNNATDTAKAKQPADAPSKPVAHSTVLEFVASMLIWIVLSVAVILINKHVLTDARFDFPATLTLIHMITCTLLSTVIVHGRCTPHVELDASSIVRLIVPISALFASSMWLGNSAYMFLSVSYIQMLKAFTPVMVYLAGLLVMTEKFSNFKASIMFLITAGSYMTAVGELKFSMVGLVCQVRPIATSSEDCNRF